MAGARWFLDCRELSPGSGCTLRLAGEPGEVLDEAARHAARAHGLEDNPRQRERARKALREEATDWSGRPEVAVGSPEMLRIT